MTDIDVDAYAPTDGIDVDAYAPDDIDVDAFAPEKSGGLADLAGLQGEAGVTDWETAREYAPLALSVGTGILSGGAPMGVQMLASALAGAAGRKITGEDPLDPVGVGVDLAALPVINAGIGIAKGVAKPLMRQAYKGIDRAKSILDWADLPNVDLTDVATRPQEVLEPSTTRFIKEAISSPVGVGKKADAPALQTLASRVEEYPYTANRLATYLDEAEREAFSEPGIFRRKPLPTAEREQIKLVQEGLLDPSEVSSRVRRGVDVLRKTYGETGELGERWGLLNEQAPRIEGYSGPNVPREKGVPVLTQAQTTAPEHGGARTMRAFERKLGFDPSYHSTDALEIFREFRKRYEQPLAASRVFGPKARGVDVSTSTDDFGSVANELLNRAASVAPTGRDVLAKKLLTDSLKDIYQYRKPSEAARFLGRRGQDLATVFLPRTWARQIGQQGWNVGRYGLQNTAEGLVRYLRDPDFRALIESSGARTGSMAQHFAEMRPEVNPNLVGRSIGTIERQLRGPLSAGSIPYQEGLLSRAVSGERSRGLTRQLTELGIDPGAIVEPYTPSASLVRDAFARGVGRTQLMSGSPGQSSAHIIGDPIGRAGAQFKPYSLGAARLAREDVLDPILSGLRHGDMSELGLGAGRLGRIAASSPIMEAVALTLAGAQAGQMPEFMGGEMPRSGWGDLVERSLQTNIGMPADIGYSVGRSFAEGGPVKGAWNAPAQLLGEMAPPIAGFLENPTSSTVGLGALAAVSPRAAGYASMAMPWLRAHTGLR